MFSSRATALPLLLLVASCAHPIGAQAREGDVVRAGEGTLRSNAELEPELEDAACSFEDGYRDQCNERGSTGVAAESMASVLESMVVLCGADGEEGDAAEADPKDTDKDSDPIQF